MRSTSRISKSQSTTQGNFSTHKYGPVISFDDQYGRFSDVGKSRYFKTAYVCISKIVAKKNPNLERLEDKKGKFTSVASLVMLKENREFFLLINNVKREERLPLNKIVSRKLTNGKLFTIKFADFEVTLNFLHRREAEIFNKYIGRIVNPDTHDEELIKTPTLTRPSERKKQQRGMFQSVAISANERIEDVIREEKSTEWTYRHVRFWLQHIHVQPESEGGEIITLYNYFERVNFVQLVEKYFDEGNTIYNLEKQLLAHSINPDKVDREILPLVRNKIIREKLLKQIKIIRLNEGFFAVEYFRVLKKRIESAKKHLKKSNDPNLVLSLDHLESRMMHEELHLWNKHYLRNYLLFSILYNHSLKSYITNLTKTFNSLLQKAVDKDKERERKKKEEDDDEDEDEGEEEEDEIEEGNVDFDKLIRKEKERIDEEWKKDVLYINHRTFERVLGSFNTEHNIHLEVLSFPVWLKVKQNLLRRRREKLVDRTKPLEEKEEELVIEVEEARAKANRWKMKMEGMEQKAKEEEEREKREHEEWMKKNSDAGGRASGMSGMVQKRKSLMLRCGKMKEKYEVVLEEMEKKLADLREDLRENRLEIPKRRKRYNHEILSYCPRRVDPELEKEFLVKKQRFSQIDKMVENKLDEILEKSPVDFSVKLVLSYQRNPDHRRERPPTKSRNYYVDWLHRGDELLHFPFFRFGLVHASLIIKNVNFHWLANSLVRVNEIREDLSNTFNEIACVDVDCPMLFLKKESLLKKFDAVAKAIVFWNAEIVYSDWHLPLLESNSRNCQEFVTFVMENVLNYTPFFDVVQKYVERDLKNWVRDKYRSKEPGWRTELMYFPVTDEFREKFKDVLEEHFHLLWAPRNKGIVFRSHDELDNLVHNLGSAAHEQSLEVMFPGEYQLLKSLDRAFWIKARRGETENNEPSQERGCPFNSRASLKRKV